MKRIMIMGMLACLFGAVAMAQEHKCRVHVLNEDYYEVDSAKVTVISTGKSYYTDRHGYVMISDMPLLFDSLEITRGRRHAKATPAVHVRMLPETMKPFSWFVKAGFGCFAPNMKFKGFPPEFFIGGGAEIRLGRIIAFQPSVHFVYRKGRFSERSSWMYDEMDRYMQVDETTYEIGALEIPMLFAWKVPVSQYTNFQFQLGPYIGLGLWGDVTFAGRYHYESDLFTGERFEMCRDRLFGKRFTGGGAVGIGVEFRHYILGASGRVGVTSWEYNEGFFSVLLEMGYKF